MKKFDEWNKIKKDLDKRDKIITLKEREIYWASIGENIKLSLKDLLDV